MRRSLLLISIAACGGSAPHQQQPGTGSGTATVPVKSGPPVAAVKPVTDTYHGVSVSDPYQWLEGDGDDVKAWSAGQNTYARGILDHLPDVAKLRTEIHDILAAPVTLYGNFHVAGGKLFGFRKQPDKEQPELIVMDDPSKADQATLLLDPSAASAQTAIDWFVPSPDGKKVAVSLSQGGSEEGTVHVIDLTGKELDDPIPDVQRGTGGGDVAWTPDGKGFYYTRYPAAGEKPDDERNFWINVWFHTIGAKDKDHYEVGKDLPKIAEVLLETDAKGNVLASAQNGDGGTFRHYLKVGKSWRQLDDWGDGIVSATFGGDGAIWMVSRKDAPRGKLEKLATSAKSAKAAKVIVPEGKDTIVTDFGWQIGPLVTKDRLYVTYNTGGPTELRTFTTAGKKTKTPSLPPISSVGQPVAWKGGVVISTRSYTTPNAYVQIDKAGAMAPIAALSPPAPVDLSSFEVSREMATSKDGTQIPLNIVWPAGAAKDGSTPCVVYGYGGYGISEQPNFLAAEAPLLQRGVCWVDVNLRGGSEFGEEWHQAGMLTAKQNVFDDFAAAVQYLIDQKYTSTDKLAILGGSNGGLLMGAMITQHPELVHAVVSEVGIYDMLRVELSPNGAYNVTEFGSVADEDQFKALYAYSPYHHVVKGTKYPAILMTTGANDPRVSPWQSRKMIAALQAAQAGDAPILLRTTDKAGHGQGSSMSEQIDLLAHVEGFLLAQLTGR